MDSKSILKDNFDKIHTTELGIVRIKKNLKLDNIDVVEYIKNLILDDKSTSYKNGKNHYIEIDDKIITINSFNYCVITAHKK